MTSARLDMVPAAIEHLDAELDAPERLEGLLGARRPASWPPGEWDRAAMSHFRDRLREDGPVSAGWYGWYAIRRGAVERPAELVGACGFFGPPREDGTVEIGYSVVPEARGHGLATEMIGALASHAFASPGVTRVVAHVRPDNEPSWRALASAGFARTGDIRSSGEERWERRGPDGATRT